MAELAFLDAVATFLGGASLSPAAKSLGVIEPSDSQDLPAVILSLDRCARERTGVGGKRATERMRGALPRTAVIDLAQPQPPDDPTFSLIDASRTQLILPHGGLVRADGSAGTLTSADLTVTIDASSLTVVTAAPAAGQVQASAQDGVLTFGTPLPPNGTLTATYNLGSWEQELIRLNGSLRIDVCADTADTTRQLSDQIATRLLDDTARTAIRRLYTIELSALTGVAVRAGDPLNAPRRSALFAFLYEHELNTPDASGRVIRAIPVTSSFFPE
jgi:hypothetical protein